MNKIDDKYCNSVFLPLFFLLTFGKFGPLQNAKHPMNKKNSVNTMNMSMYPLPCITRDTDNTQYIYHTYGWMGALYVVPTWHIHIWYLNECGNISEPCFYWGNYVFALFTCHCLATATAFHSFTTLLFIFHTFLFHYCVTPPLRIILFTEDYLCRIMNFG